MSNYLPYELQRYSETVVRIPFILKSPIFKEFYQTEKGADLSMTKMAVNDSPFSEGDKAFTLRPEIDSARKRRGEDRYLAAAISRVGDSSEVLCQTRDKGELNAVKQIGNLHIFRSTSKDHDDEETPTTLLKLNLGQFLTQQPRVETDAEENVQR